MIVPGLEQIVAKQSWNGKTTSFVTGYKSTETLSLSTSVKTTLARWYHGSNSRRNELWLETAQAIMELWLIDADGSYKNIKFLQHLFFWKIKNYNTPQFLIRCIAVLQQAARSNFISKIVATTVPVFTSRQYFLFWCSMYVMIYRMHPQSDQWPHLFL